MTRSARRTAAAMAAAFVLAVLVPLVSLAASAPAVQVAGSGSHVRLSLLREQVGGEQAVLVPRLRERLLPAGLPGGHERPWLPAAALVASCVAAAVLLRLVLSPPGLFVLAPAHRFLLWLRAPPGA